jgi:hypothetical protein
MISQLEFSARAALCRQLANQEPANRALWMAEAENWLRLRLSLERLRGAGSRTRGWAKIGSDILAISLRARSATCLSVSASARVA